MSRLNDEFMEIYKRIDSFIREAYHSDKGVTTYIDEMNSKAGASWSILGWNETLEQLKNYRHIRNSYSHDVGSSYSDICTPEDIRWLQSFYSKLMSAQDPMSLYLKQKQEASKKVTRTYVRPVEADKKEETITVEHEENRSTYQYTAPPRKSKGGCLIVLFIVLISIIIIVALMFLLFGAGISFGFKFFDSLFSLLVQ
jgi:hypothetical protein